MVAHAPQFAPSVSVSARNAYFATLSDDFGVLVKNLIHFPKVLIAAVNGPAIGFGTTVLPHCDFVYASQQAFFQTPFVQLGINAEGCSSYTFPLLMGTLKANELLLQGKRMDAKEAEQVGLVNKVFADNKELEQYVTMTAKALAKLPQQSLQANKRLSRERGGLLATLDQVNEVEVKTLKERWASKEAYDALMAFVNRSKL